MRAIGAGRVASSLAGGATEAGSARTCYGHLAGRLGVAPMTSMIERGHVSGGDGQRAAAEALQGAGHDVVYELTNSGRTFLDDFASPRLPAVRYCIDWTEQRHHLGGALGRGLLDRLLDLDWVRRAPTYRAVEVTAAGRDGLAGTFVSTSIRIKYQVDDRRAYLEWLEVAIDLLRTSGGRQPGC